MKLLRHDGYGRALEVDVGVLGGVGRTTVDFGAGAVEARTVVTGQTGIVAGSVVTAAKLLAATATHSADEHLIEDLAIDAGLIVPGVGFTIVARPWRFSGRLFGTFHVSWKWS